MLPLTAILKQTLQYFTDQIKASASKKKKKTAISSEANLTGTRYLTEVTNLHVLRFLSSVNEEVAPFHYLK